MAAESAPEATNKVVTVEWPQLEPTPRHAKQKMAEHAIDNFMVLAPVESPHEELRKELESVIIDQSAAIDAIIDTLDQNMARFGEDNRPLANLAFLGPTGVGKSETGKALARLLDGNFIKIDCSNFANGHEVTILTGSPPSYVGREQKSPLSKNKVEEPGTVILFDEIEKGAPELYNLMLQIMNDGELYLNNTGETVSFKDAIIIMTSNLGAKEMASRLSGNQLGFGTDKKQEVDKDRLEKVANERFEDFFAPEFVGRIDRQIVFHPLTMEGLGRVLDTKIAQANSYYEPQHGVRVSLSEAARVHLIEIAAQQPHLGARPVVRAFDSEIKKTLGRYIGSESLIPGVHVRVFSQSELPEGHGYGDESLVFGAKADSSVRKVIRPHVLMSTEPHNDRSEDEPDDEDPEGREE
ncbi:MAG: AAA family ATPase [Candidatus Saccharimonadales bacterium]